MPYPNLTDAEQAIDDFIGTAEEMQREVERTDRRQPARAVELAERALESARRWEASSSDEAA